jgi:hypothetical protein
VQLRQHWSTLRQMVFIVPQSVGSWPQVITGTCVQRFGVPPQSASLLQV